MRLPSVLALYLVLGSGCSGAHDLQGAPQPLVVLRGSVEGALPSLPAGHTLRVGVLWSGVPVYVPYCHDFGPTPLDPQRALHNVSLHGCRDPFDVVPRRSGPSVALASDRSFEIPLTQLPSADLLVGPLESRVGYASLVLYDDKDGDGEEDLLTGCPRTMGGRTGAPPEGPLSPEAVYASSFRSLTSTQVRLTYVEGPFDADSNYYPHPSCTALPPEGFSWWQVGDLLGRKDTCVVRGVEEPLRLTVTSSSSNRVVGCAQRARETFPRPLQQNDVPDTLVECLEDGSLVAASETCTCPEVRVYSLYGCFNELDCQDPDWDLRANPPELWPCPVYRGL